MHRKSARGRPGLFNYKARGETLWGVEYRDPVTHRRRRKVGFSTKGTAVEWADKNERQGLGLEPMREETAMTFDAALDFYLEHRFALGKRPSSYEYLRKPEPKRKRRADAEDQEFVETWGDVFTGRAIGSITSEESEARLKKWTEERHLSPASRNNALAQLSGLFSYCYGRRWIDSHPTERGRVPKLAVDNGRTRWLRTSEVEAIRANAPDWLSNIIMFAVKSGMRLGEICSLTKASYQTDDQNQAYVVTERTKNGDRLTWPLEGWAKTYVETRVAECRFPADNLFPGPGGGNAETAIKRSLPKIVEKAGLKYGRKKPDGVTFHSFRHTMASIALNNGISETIVQRMGNWRDRRMVARYSHLADDSLRKAVAQLDAITSAASKPKRSEKKAAQRA